MLAVSSSAGQDRYTAGEWDVTLSTSLSSGWLVWCHGNNQTATSDYTSYNEQLRTLAQRNRVVTADLGGDSFGNDTGIARVESLRTYLGAETLALVGLSMGAAVALNYARVHPTRVTAIVCVIPALDLNVDNGHAAADEIDAAYPPAYDPEDEEHAAHSPVNFADDLPTDLPIGLWTSSNDPTCLPATADAFVAARPQTQRVVFGAYGHGGITVAVPLVEAWLRTVRS